MSSQVNEGITFLYDREQRGLRLLELPPELVETMVSDCLPRLTLKSAQSVSQNDPSAELTQVVLCTENKTYHLRQVQTSNTVLIAEPHDFRGAPNAISKEALCAFATCTSTLEVLPQSLSNMTKNKSAVERIREMVPIYHSGGTFAKPSQKRNKASIFSNIPYSDRECEDAWSAEIVFECKEGSWIPANNVLLDMWKTLFQTAVSQGDDLCLPLRLMSFRILLEEIEFPEELVEAFLSFLLQIDTQSVDDNDLVCLHKSKTLTMIGKLCVTQNLGDESDGAVLEALEMWQKLLPDQWRIEASLQQVVALRTTLRAASGFVPSSSLAEAENGAKRLPTGRNWHEKLISKRTKR